MRVLYILSAIKIYNKVPQSMSQLAIIVGIGHKDDFNELFITCL